MTKERYIREINYLNKYSNGSHVAKFVNETEMDCCNNPLSYKPAQKRYVCHCGKTIITQEEVNAKD